MAAPRPHVKQPDVHFSLHHRQGEALNTRATEVLFGGAAGGGKALCLKTPIPTPTGWTTMGEIMPGDMVLDERGLPCRVVALSAIETPVGYRVTFDDGATVDACENHRWITYTAKELAALTRRCPEWRAARRARRPKRGTGKKPWLSERNSARRPPGEPPPTGGIRTTAEILATLRAGRRLNHAVPVAAPLELPEIPLPIDPYTLGAWLGDGTSQGGGFTGQDPVIWREIEAAGYTVTHAGRRDRHFIRGLMPQLRAAGLLENKHVPPAYLRAGRAQRLALLQGLMDTDGTVTESGECEFTNTNQALALAVADLVHGLGWKGRLVEGRAKLNGMDCGPKWDIAFTPSEHVFRLPRKRAAQRIASRRTTRFRYVVSVEPIAPVPMRCIQVDSPSHLYLAGVDMVPTHNSHLMRVAAILWCLQIPGLQIYLFRRTVKDLEKNHMKGPTSFPVLLHPLVTSRYVRIVKNEVRFANGSCIFLNHCEHEADADNYRGYEFQVLMIDEVTHFTERQYRMLQSRVRMTDDFKNAAVPEHLRECFPRILCSGNPGGPGHHFVKAHWIDHGAMVIHNTPPDWAGVLSDALGGEPLVVRPRQFIPSSLADNPSLNRREYAATLAGLNDPILVRAMLDGDWTVVAGAMFGDVWRTHLHVCPSFEIPADWPLWRGADDGFANAHCTLWGTRDPNTGTVFAIDELYGTKMLPDEIIQRVKEIDARIPITDGETSAFNARPLSGILDNAAWNDTGLGAARGTPTEKNSRGDAFTKGGLNFHRSKKGPRCRQLDAQNIQKMLAKNPRDADGNPSLMVFSKCVNLIRTLPAIMRDLKDPEDWADGQEDHALDALRNLLQWKDGGFKLHRVG